MTPIHKKIKVTGEFDIKVGRNLDRPRVSLSGLRNMVLDRGINQFFTVQFRDTTAYCHVGTGSTPPTAADTTLQSPVANVFRTGPVVAAFDPLDSARVITTQTYVFGTGVAAGVLSEIGLGLSNGNLATRALFVDENDDPVTVTVLADEQLQVTYRIIFVVDTDDAVLVENTGPTPTDYTVTIRPSEIGTTLGITDPPAANAVQSVTVHAYTGGSSGLGATTAIPAGTQQEFGSTLSNSAYTNGNFYRDSTITVPLAAVNGAAIGALAFIGPWFRWQVGISPRITKNNTQTISLTVRQHLARA